MSILISKKMDKRLGDELIPKTSRILKYILKISVPAAAETLLIGVIGLIDTMMVGSLGTVALASVSICQQPIFITLAAAFGFRNRLLQYTQDGLSKCQKSSLRNNPFLSFWLTKKEEVCSKK